MKKMTFAAFAVALIAFASCASKTEAPVEAPAAESTEAAAPSAESSSVDAVKADWEAIIAAVQAYKSLTDLEADKTTDANMKDLEKKVEKLMNSLPEDQKLELANVCKEYKDRFDKVMEEKTKELLGK